MSPAGIWDAFNDPNLDGWHQLWIHVRLSLEALVLATVIGVTLGVVAAKTGRVTGFVVSAVANLGRTIPTFALLALAVALSTIGEGPTLVGLVALGVPPVLLNAHTGIREVDRGAVEAARGMGFTPLAVLGRVELPMALPLVFTGIRVSAIQIVATAALGASVGANGLGVLILSGLANADDEILLAGAIPTALLALAVGGMLALAERLLTPRGLRLARASRPTKTMRSTT
ncbi:MAG: ABC transporter permease [Thermoleophilia bacterium]|nr:ABC transporter permease [Thermoleophilia bacterium]